MPASAIWIRSLPLSATPSLANKYVPCSVALEHLAAAASGAALSSAANAFPAPARANADNRVNVPMRFFMSPPAILSGAVRAAGGCSRRASRKSTVKQSSADQYTSSMVGYSRLVSADRRFLNHARKGLINLRILLAKSLQGDNRKPYSALWLSLSG